jgi:hypothetical protein
VDPAVLERRELLRSQLAQIQQASTRPRNSAAGEIGAACRRLLSLARDGERAELDRIIGECDALAFAPAADAHQRIDENLHRRAVELAQRLAQERS